MFPLHSKIGSGQVSFSSLNIMPCICSTLYAMLLLACLETPLPLDLLVARCCQHGKNPKAFLVARFPTRMRTILKAYFYISRRYNLQLPFRRFRGYMGLRVG